MKNDQVLKSQIKIESLELMKLNCLAINLMSETQDRSKTVTIW